MGVLVSVDEFGKAFSSITHLRVTPINEIQIAKSFILGMSTSEADAAIVRTVIDLAHNLGKQVCAEGVETEETWKRLCDMGCDLAQGYWIARPLPALQLDRWLAEND